MFNIKSLNNKQLGLYQEMIHEKITILQKAIMEDIMDIFGKMPSISYETYNDIEKFHTYCKTYRSSIEEEKKEIFLALKKQQKEIKKEIRLRQRQLLEEIEIYTPSMRVEMIMKETEGQYFESFDNMIKYIKMIKKGKENKRSKNKKIYIPQKLVEQFERLGTTVLTVIANNLGPLPN